MLVAALGYMFHKHRRLRRSFQVGRPPCTGWRFRLFTGVLPPTPTPRKMKNVKNKIGKIRRKRKKAERLRK
jgi:hypothetical protein